MIADVEFNLIESLIVELNTLASLSKGMKISTIGEYINLERESTMQALYRSVSGDNRHRATMAIKRIVQTTFDFLHVLMESRYFELTPQKNNGDDSADVAYFCECRQKRLHLIYRAYEALKISRRGLKTLLDTYSEDNNVIIALNTIDTAIEINCKKYAEWLLGNTYAPTEDIKVQNITFK